MPRFFLKERVVANIRARKYVGTLVCCSFINESTRSTDNIYGIRFDEHMGGHSLRTNLTNYCEWGFGWFCSLDQLSLEVWSENRPECYKDWKQLPSLM